MRARGTSGTPTDREIWRRSQEIEAVPDEADHLMDLAAFADNRLDDDDADRIAALIARDGIAAEDIAVARMLAGATMLAADAAAVAWAEALVGENRRDHPEAELIAFPRRPTMVRRWYSAASWSGLAAAIVLAGWVGFDLGSGLSAAPPPARAADEVSASDLLDPAPLLLRDFTDSSQI
jgi:hypothetical protein